MGCKLDPYQCLNKLYSSKSFDEADSQDGDVAQISSRWGQKSEEDVD